MTTGSLPSLEYTRLEIGGASYLVGTTGSGPPALLLHGFPQTHYCWRRIVPILAERHTVVATDLRGYGATSAPAGGPKGEGYTKREMASDLVELMATLGLRQFAVVGHDRGARVAYRMALDHQSLVERLVVLNVIPTLDQFERMGAGPSLGYWPWFLFAQPRPFPERLLATDRQLFLRFIFDSWSEEPGAIEDEAFDVYLQALDGTTIASICGDYRASFWLDREHELADRRAGRRIRCPVLLVTGAAETQLADAREIWHDWAVDLRARTVPGGHFLPEEASSQLGAALLEFLGEPSAPPRRHGTGTMRLRRGEE
jgi:haloacetate dehalogenase